MLVDEFVVDMSRLQFAMTVLYHFLFVPLTLGLSFMLAIMESVYVMTGRKIWRDMVKFWGVLFGINFVLGVSTGITMEFQFGMNWAYFSHYVGDIFGAPLAIEGMMAFFLEATLIGLFYFGWDRMSNVKHLAVTWFMALGTSLSALWILIANGWMQNPVGANFNYETMRMEVTNFAAVIFNPVAQAKFVHTVSAGYVLGAAFIMAISAFYVLKGRHIALAKRSMAVASAFGLLASLSVVVLGDESGYVATEHQKMKLAAIEAMFETEEAPANFNLFGIPDTEARDTHYEIQVPGALGVIATRSFTEVLPGINELEHTSETRIRSGAIAYDALLDLQENPDDADAVDRLNAHKDDMGYGMLLLRYTEDPISATDEQVTMAASDTVPNVGILFWSFRIMVAIGFYLILFFAFAFYLSAMRTQLTYKWFLKLCIITLPLPWIAVELGWLVAEYGRQPWLIEGGMPTFLGVSAITRTDILITLIGFVLVYSILAIIEIKLMLHSIKKGPVYEAKTTTDVVPRKAITNLGEEVGENFVATPSHVPMDE